MPRNPANKMRNPNLRTKDPRSYKWMKPGLPTKQNCDLSDPREMFLWMFVGLPGVNGAPMMMPAEVFMMWSEHFYECGARLVEAPEKKYCPPTQTDPHAMTSPGDWVPAKTPDPPRDAAAIWQGLPWQKQAELVQAIFSDADFWERLPVTLKKVLREALGDPA